MTDRTGTPPAPGLREALREVFEPYLSLAGLSPTTIAKVLDGAAARLAKYHRAALRAESVAAPEGHDLKIGGYGIHCSCGYYFVGFGPNPRTQRSSVECYGWRDETLPEHLVRAALAASPAAMDAAHERFVHLAKVERYEGAHVHRGVVVVDGDPDEATCRLCRRPSDADIERFLGTRLLGAADPVSKAGSTTQDAR